MITLERASDGQSWSLKAHGDQIAHVNPIIAELVGFDSTFHYRRHFLGNRHVGYTEARITRMNEASVVDDLFPQLLDIRHGDWGRWYILHGLDFDHLQLTQVNQAMMDHLVAQPLFAAHAIGSFRLLDPDVDLPPERRPKRHSERPEVLASPVDTSGAVGVYNNVVIHEGPQPEWIRIAELARARTDAAREVRERRRELVRNMIGEDAEFPGIPSTGGRRNKKKKPDPKPLVSFGSGRTFLDD